MKTKIIRILMALLGLFMIIIGFNKFLVSTEIPNPPGNGGTLMQIYINSGFLKIVGVQEIIGGIALFINRFVPIGLTLITAIMFNAMLIHALHDPSGIGPAAVCLLLSVIMIAIEKERFTRFFGAL